MPSIPIEPFIWLGIFVCICQSGMFSGLNLALLGISRLRLEVNAQAGDKRAQKILELRKDFNFLLCSILWSNVAINVLLTLLSNSVLTGVAAFMFSTFLITFGGEILPQAYFSRHTLRMGSLLAPMVRFYQILFYPVAKPSAMLLDLWLGREGISLFRERDLHTVIRKHYESGASEVGEIEGIGAINFLELDDVAIGDAGQPLDEASIVMLPHEAGQPVFPAFARDPADPFLHRVSTSGRKWVIIVDETERPRMALNAHLFLRQALFARTAPNPLRFCHRPIVVDDPELPLGDALPEFRVYGNTDDDDAIEHDLILLWSDGARRVITGTDILGRLLRDIAARAGPAEPVA